MQTILGANGHIGRPLAKELAQYTDQIRLVSRTPKAINPADQLYAADLFKREEVMQAVADSSIVYLTIGIPYRDPVWAKHWVPLIKNVIDACEAAQAKLVFFDNVYMYAPDEIDGMDENTSVQPATFKGKIRAEVARLVLEAHQQGRIQAVICRAADFYGPNCTSSVIHETVVKPAVQGKTMRWLYNIDQPHNFTFTLDAAKATAQLGNDPSAYGRVWHLPSSPTFTGQGWMEKIWTSAGRPLPAKTATLPSWMAPLLGLFLPEMKALHKMRYQYQNPYRLDDSAFVAKYGWTATPVEEAIRAIVEAEQKT
ncbi:MAG: NAD-dependent epimerase/dehydratase family protein [Bacteroidota bacterium]